MSTSAIRFAPRTRAQRGIRTGMLAYLGVAEQVQAEVHAEAQAALVAAECEYMWRQIEKPVAATRVGTTRIYQTHYAAGVTVTYRTRKHTLLTANY